jgi:hypothetical protein
MMKWLPNRKPFHPGRWYKAANSSFNGNDEPLINIFSEIIRPTVAIDFESLPIDQIVKSHPELLPIQQKFSQIKKIIKMLIKRI